MQPRAMGNRRKKRRDEAWLPAAVQQSEEGRGMESRPSASVGVAQRSHSELRRRRAADAEELARYAQTHPRAPAVILGELRRQGLHRRERECEDQRLESRALEAAIFSERMGVVCAFLIALVG